MHTNGSESFIHEVTGHYRLKTLVVHNVQMMNIGKQYFGLCVKFRLFSSLQCWCFYLHTELKRGNDWKDSSFNISVTTTASSPLTIGTPGTCHFLLNFPENSLKLTCYIFCLSDLTVWNMYFNMHSFSVLERCFCMLEYTRCLFMKVI